MGSQPGQGAHSWRLTLIDWVTIGFGILFFVLIMASIALHEVGHMAPAKLFGIRVPQYFVGFGPTIWSKRVGETEYGLKWIPLGGFVRLLGMYPPAKSREGTRPSRLQDLADSARGYEWSQITATDVETDRLFYQKKTWQKLIVMAGGPMMNVLLAFLIFWGVTGLYGQPRPQLEVSFVQTCIVRENAQDRTCPVTNPTNPSPAYQAGLQVGDKILTFNGEQMDSWDEFSTAIRANLDREARITVERGGQTVALRPVRTVIDGVADKWDPSKRIEAGWLGVSPVRTLEKGGPVETLGDMWTMTIQSGVALLQFPVKVFNVAADMITGKPRDIYGPMSIVGASVTAGEVVSSDQFDVPAKMALFASLLASVNLFLALFNFIPLLPLDGGHIAGAIFEALRRWFAKLFHRLDPGPVDTAKMLPVAYVVGGFILICGIVLIVADVISPIKLL